MRKAITASGPDGTETEFPTLGAAAKALGVSIKTLGRALSSGKPTSALGFPMTVRPVVTLRVVENAPAKELETLRVRNDQLVLVHSWADGLAMETADWRWVWEPGYQIEDDGVWTTVVGYTVSAEE